METMLKTSGQGGGRRILGCSATKPRRAGDTCHSTEAHGNVLEVSRPSSIAAPHPFFLIASLLLLKVDLVDFAMTEASYTVVRLLQRFSVLEKPRLKKELEVSDKR